MKSAGSPAASAVCRASASAMSLSLLVSARSMSPDSGAERCLATGRDFAAARPASGPDLVSTPAWSSSSPKASAASRAGSVLRWAGPLAVSSRRPSLTIRALSGAMFSLGPIGWSAGPE